MQNEFKPEETSSIATARDRLQTGAIPGWVIECPYSPQFTVENHAPITHLLMDTQIHAEHHEAFFQQVIRLETMEAVQHFSQWRIQFEPQTQLITLHKLKIRRGEVETDHLNLEKAHLLQREEGLEKFVILGWFTFLMILDDVRPGDILEFAYTIQTQSRLLPENISFIFALPQAVSIGSYHFAVQFDATRGMKWKSNNTSMAPVESRSDAAVLWKWSGENFIGPKPENNMPSWHLSYPWIQISDFSGWQTIAGAIAESWAVERDDRAVADLAQEIENRAPDLPARIETAIRLIQDEYRYLSVNLEFGGQIPSAPETVIQRRFGDCKDLSWLLANILGKLGVSARPVLVNTFLRKTIGEFLPAPSMFNHVVVEFESDGNRRWVDTTLQQQGGGPFNRIIGAYELGLPVDANVGGLVNAPQTPAQSSLLELRETILLDSSGQSSQLAVVQRNEGHQADLLRQQLAKAGLEELARQRLQSASGRFKDACRVGTLQFRDDRTNNQFVLAEVFEFRPFLANHPNPQLCRFQLPTGWITGALAMPEKSARTTPFALPYPCHITHEVDVESPSIQNMKISEPRSQLSNPFVQFSRSDKTGRGYFLMKLMLETKGDSVSADQVEQHGEIVEQIWQAASRQISVPRGYSCPRKPRGFGELPPVPSQIRPATGPVQAPLPLQVPAATVHPSNTTQVEASPRERRHKHHHSYHHSRDFPLALKIGLAAFIAFGLFLIFLAIFRPVPHP